MCRSRILLTLAALCLLAAACGPAPEPGRDDPSPQAAATPTAPVTPSPEPRLVFAVKGDWGAGTREQAAVTNRMCEMRKTTPFEAVITTGDNFYSPDGVATQANYFTPEACLTEHPGHRWRAVWGNHDSRGDSTATVLGASERTYTWTAGRAEFFMLDSNRVGDRSQQAWLEAELARSQAPVKVAVFHHPPLTAGLHEDSLAVRRSWVPLFERHGVDLVLNGHNHGYEHSFQNGIHYVVTGGGGAELYPCVDDPPTLVTCRSENHFLLLELEGEALSVEAVGVDGVAIDGFAVGEEPA